MDGWRCPAWALGDRIHLQSRHGRDLTPYFPDLAACLQNAVPPGAVLDGELLSWDPATGRTSFRALQRRVTAGRALTREAAAHPAHLVTFDLLADAGGVPLLGRPLTRRRARLCELLAGAGPQLPVSPQTPDIEQAREWLRDWTAAGVEGLVAKPLTGRYLPGRTGWIKHKAFTTTEAIIGGVTGTLTAPRTLLLGRLDRDGGLRCLGRTHPLAGLQSRDLAHRLRPAPPGRQFWPEPLPATWTGLAGRSEPLPFQPVISDLVVEVRIDAAYESGRLRHGARYERLRPDLEPADLPLWAPDGLTARGSRPVSDIPDSTLAVAWPRDARSPAIAAFVRAACAVAATTQPQAEPTMRDAAT